MRVAILTDTHWGARGESRTFLNYFERFYTETFFPYLDRWGIDTVYHLGDLVDRRKYTSYVTIQCMRTAFLDRLGDRRLVIIPGNHDAFFKTSLEVNAVRELLGTRDNITIADEPRFVNDGILMLPWICPANEIQSTEAITKARNNSRPIIMGHLELKGFQTQRGQIMENGMDPTLFSGFPLVLSGHYHHRNSLNNIHYLGCPYEITWADANDPKGFHIFDTDTLELEFIPNPLRMHERLEFDDREKMEIDFADYHDKIVKVAVIHRDDSGRRFDAFMRQMENAGPTTIQVIDDNLVKVAADDGRQQPGNLQDTLDILLTSVVNDVTDSVDKDRLRELLAGLYQEAERVQK